MALFQECVHSCAHIVLDTADIARMTLVPEHVALRSRAIHVKSTKSIDVFLLLSFSSGDPSFAERHV
jgi:hypothetical protein